MFLSLQEFVLSHRTLIFTKDRIYFRCRENCWSEDTIYDNFPSAVNKVLDSGSKIDFLTDNEPDPFSAYYTQLFRYTQRCLTKESDTIHGITGILRSLSIQARSGVLEGLFTACFDVSLIFWDIFPDTSKPERQEGFPSWSWAGWRGVGGRYGYARWVTSSEDINSWLQRMTYIVWYKRSPGTGKLELVWDFDSQLKYGEPETHNIGYRPSPTNPYGRTIDDSLENLRTRPNDTEDIHHAAVIREEMIKRNYHFLHFFAHVVFVEGFDAPDDEPNATMRALLGVGGKICGMMQFEDHKLMKGVEGSV